MANDFESSPADVLAALLVSAGLGTDPSDDGGWPVFATSEPDSPDEVITVYDTTGKSDGRLHVTGESTAHFGFQIRVRSLLPADGWLKADSIRNWLALGVYQDNVTLGSKNYLVHAATNIGQVLSLGKEVPASRRSLFTLNGYIVLRQTN